MRKMGINAVLTLAVLASLFVGIAALIVYTATSTFSISTTLQEQALTQTAKSAASVLDLFIENAKDQVENLANLRVAQEALSGDPARTYLNLAGGMAAWQSHGLPIVRHD